VAGRGGALLHPARRLTDCTSARGPTLAESPVRHEHCLVPHRKGRDMEAVQQDALAPDTLPFRTLLYRYFFFAWLFRDAGVRDLLERAAALNHNRAAARWLPTYMKRWVVVGIAGWAIGSAVELLLGAPLSLLFFLPSVMSVPISSVILVAWLWLRLPF
jgi:hypothetical protein